MQWRIKTLKDKMGVIALLLFLSISCLYTTDFVTGCFHWQNDEIAQRMCDHQALQNKVINMKYDGLIVLGGLFAGAAALYWRKMLKSKKDE